MSQETLVLAMASATDACTEIFLWVLISLLMIKNRGGQRGELDNLIYL